MERKKARIFAETRVILRGTGLRRIELLVIKLNQLEFSPGSAPAVRFRGASVRQNLRVPWACSPRENRLLSAALLRTAGAAR